MLHPKGRGGCHTICVPLHSSFAVPTPTPLVQPILFTPAGRYSHSLPRLRGGYTASLFAPYRAPLGCATIFYFLPLSLQVSFLYACVLIFIFPSAIALGRFIDYTCGSVPLRSHFTTSRHVRFTLAHTVRLQSATLIAPSPHRQPQAL